jgi:hypothetical protein
VGAGVAVAVGTYTTVGVDVGGAGTEAGGVAVASHWAMAGVHPVESSVVANNPITSHCIFPAKIPQKTRKKRSITFVSI